MKSDSDKYSALEGKLLRKILIMAEWCENGVANLDFLVRGLQLETNIATGIMQ